MDSYANLSVVSDDLAPLVHGEKDDAESDAKSPRSADVPNVKDLINMKRQFQQKITELQVGIKDLGDLPWSRIDGKDVLTALVATKAELEEARKEADALKKAGIDYERRECKLKNSIKDLSLERDQAVRKLQISEDSQSAQAVRDVKRMRKILDLTDELSDVKKSLNGATAENLNLRRKLEELEAERLTTQENRQGVRCTKAECSQKVAQAMEKVEALKSQLATKKEEARRAASTIKEYSSRMETLSRGLKAATAQSMSASMRIDDDEVDQVIADLAKDMKQHQEEQSRGRATTQGGGDGAGKQTVDKPKQNAPPTVGTVDTDSDSDDDSVPPPKRRFISTSTSSTATVASTSVVPRAQTAAANLTAPPAKAVNNFYIYSCQSCKMTFTDSASSKRHKDENHRIIECEYCGRRFTRKSSLVKHVKNKHTDDE